MKSLGKLILQKVRALTRILGIQQALETLNRFTHRADEVASRLRGRERKVFIVFVVIFLVAGVGIITKINEEFIVYVPTQGGSLKEGVIGAPRFINPLLAISDADRDLTSLIYSGLLRATPKGELIPDLAKGYTRGEDGLTYTFTLKNGLVWHDGKPVTSDDVIFTIERVKDSVLKSPKRASWEGVSVEKINEKTVRFTLDRQYSPFLENTTLGILPQHIWDNISSEQFGFSRYNIDPIGSGPYRVTSIANNSSGIPKYYKLSAFRHFALGEPYIQDLEIHFYPNEGALIDAFNRQDVEAVNAITFQNIEKLNNARHQTLRYVLPRVFGVFFNQNENNIFTNFSIRRALAEATPREKIIDEVLLGYATAIDGPLPPGSLGFTKEEAKNSPEEVRREERAETILENAGWELNEETGVRENDGEPLSFSLSTSNTPELKKTAQMIRDAWRAIGANVELRVWSASDLNRNVIRTRNYEALLFGEIIGRESDPFAFWHSSQRNDPGLNIALYTNITTDNLLEKGRVTFNSAQRAEIYKEFQDEIREDIPAIFVYSPDFIYITPKKIEGVTTGIIAVPSERFLDINTWYIETERLWKIFKD